MSRKRNYFGVENPELLRQHNQQIICQNMRALVGNVKPWEPDVPKARSVPNPNKQQRSNRPQLDTKFEAVEDLLDRIEAGKVSKPKTLIAFTNLLGLSDSWIFVYPELTQRVREVCEILTKEEAFEINKSRAWSVLEAIERGKLKASSLRQISRLCGMNNCWIHGIPELKAEAVRVLDNLRESKNA